MLFNAVAASTLLLASSATATMMESSAMMESASMSASMPMSTGAAGMAGEGQIMVQVVQVGGANGSLAYYPEKVTAPPGSVVQFQFMPKNHTVTQAAFDSPCVPLSQSNSSAASTMIKSGFMPTAMSDSQRPVFSVAVNNTQPIWLFCGQKTPVDHCSKGMVMVINENAASGKTLEAFKAKAMQSSGGASASGTGAGASGTSSSGPAQQTTNAAARPVVGISAFAGLLAAAYFLL